MIAYKLFSVRKDGTLRSLFINRSQRIRQGVWLAAEPHRTAGFKFRPGWHCTTKPEAPHLGTSGRAWYRVEIEDYEAFERPKAQGGTWLLAKRMRVLEPVA